MRKARKPLVWRHGEVKTPPFSSKARIDTGVLLGRLQEGEKISMPDSRPMPNIGKRCHELRVTDGRVEWRIIYRTDSDAVVIADVFKKKSEKTPKPVIDSAKIRFKRYDDEAK